VSPHGFEADRASSRVVESYGHLAITDSQTPLRIVAVAAVVGLVADNAFSLPTSQLYATRLSNAFWSMGFAN